METDQRVLRRGMGTWVPLLLTAIAVVLLAAVALYRRGPSSRDDQSQERRTTAGNAGVIAEVDPNHWKIQNSLKTTYLQDPGRLNTDLQLKPTPGMDPQEVTEIRIASISPESPMFLAGFRKNDRILKVNDSPVTSMGRAVNLVHEVRQGTRLTVQVERNGKIIDYRFDFE